MAIWSPNGKTGKVNAPFRRLNVKMQADALRREVPPLPGNGPYGPAMIDIPWAYEPHDDLPERGVLPYATLSIKQACDLDIDSIMHADAVLFMWVTNFILARGLHLEISSGMGRLRAEDCHHMAERPAHVQGALGERSNRAHGDGRTRQAGDRTTPDHVAARSVSSFAQGRAHQSPSRRTST